MGKFKIGDKVQVAEQFRKLYDRPGIYTIVGSHSSVWGRHYWELDSPNRHHNGWDDSELILVEEKNMAKEFKIGDRVKVIGSHLTSGSPHRPTQDTVGLTGEIIHIHGEMPYTVKFDDGHDSVSYLAYDLELLGDDLGNLAVGDTVTRDNCGYYGNGTFTVKNVLNGVYVGVNDDDEAVVYTPHELEEGGYELREELTLAQIEEQLGKKVKIVEE